MICTQIKFVFAGNQILSFVSAFILAYVTDRQMLVDISAGVLVFFVVVDIPTGVFLVLTSLESQITKCPAIFIIIIIIIIIIIFPQPKALKTLNPKS